MIISYNFVGEVFIIPLCQRYYEADIARYLKFCIPQKSRVLHVGCEDTLYLDTVRAKESCGFTWREDSIPALKEKNSAYEYHSFQPQFPRLDKNFEFIILSDVLGRVQDVQNFLEGLLKFSTSRTRLIITHYSRLWQPIFRATEFFTGRKGLLEENWLGYHDLAMFLYLSNWELIKADKRMLLPLYLPILSTLLNRFLVHLPFFRHLALYNILVARPASLSAKKNPSISLVVPARNEAGNIENAVARIPDMGETEIIFVEGGSSDRTWQEITRVQRKCQDRRILIAQQEGKGKGDAVRKGFSMATGDIVAILDADLTMPPEELPKYYNCLTSGLAEFANGCRLVYPFEKDSMRFFNILGNYFFSMMFSWLLGQRIKDTLCGTKMMFREDYERIAANREYFGNFDPFGDFDLIFGSARFNLKIVDIPIHYKARKYGKTNISRWKHGMMLIWMMFFAMWKIKFL